MSHEMAAHFALRLFPAAQWLGRRRKARIEAKCVQQRSGSRLSRYFRSNWRACKNGPSSSRTSSKSKA